MCCSIYSAKTAIDREIVVDTETCTKRSSENILLAMHISINLIFVEARTRTSSFYFWTYHSEQSHLTLKRAHALIELSFTTSTNEGEVELECPTIFHPSCLHRGDDRSRCSAFEEFGVAIVIVSTISKRREFRGYFASLVSRLQIKT